jgi:uncharacterized protein YggT (Ycf19 family)
MAEYEVRRSERVVREAPVVSETVIERAPSMQAERQIVEDPSASGRVLVARISGLIWLLFGILDALIVVRIILKLIAANPSSGFAQVVYSITNVFLAPFATLIASPAVGNGIFEIPSLIAIIVYSLVAWGIVRLFRLLFTPARTRQSVTTVRREL